MNSSDVFFPWPFSHLQSKNHQVEHSDQVDNSWSIQAIVLGCYLSKRDAFLNSVRLNNIFQRLFFTLASERSLDDEHHFFFFPVIDSYFGVDDKDKNVVTGINSSAAASDPSGRTTLANTIFSFALFCFMLWWNKKHFSSLHHHQNRSTVCLILYAD